MNHFMNQPNLNLGEMLAYRRPAASDTEELFIEKYIDTVDGMMQDDYGNRFCHIGADYPTVMWSCHTDTVHHKDGMQKVMIDPIRNEYIVGDDESNCLGADCTTGIYIMLKMIQAGKDGLYVFHRDEEVGGGGSIHIAKNGLNVEWSDGSVSDIMKDVKFAIALDRKGSQSIITHQGERCCSDLFGESLATQLNAAGLDYSLDPTGVFTDTANYIKIIPECTNLSVGYARQHSKHEMQDIHFPDLLLAALLKLDYDALVESRKVTDIDDEYSTWRRHGSIYDRFGIDYSQNNYGSKIKEKTPTRLSYESILALITAQPHLAAELLWDLGVTDEDLAVVKMDYDDRKDMALDDMMDGMDRYDDPPFDADLEKQYADHMRDFCDDAQEIEHGYWIGR